MSSYKDAVPVLNTDTGQWTLAYQVTNDKGEPTGSPTVFTGASEKECYRKAMLAHQEAQQAVERLRKSQTLYKPGSITDVEKEALQLREKTRLAEESYAVFKFRENHLTDYNACAANAGMLRGIMEREGLPWTPEALELAFTFAIKEGKLAPVETPYKGDTTEEAPPEPLQVPWDPNPLTGKALADMDRAEYRKYLTHSNPAIRAEFTRQVEAAQVMGYKAGRF